MVADLIVRFGSMAAADAAACAIAPAIGTGSVVRAIRRGRRRGAISAKVVRRMMASLDGVEAIAETRCRVCKSYLRREAVLAGHSRCEAHRPIAAFRALLLAA